MAQRVAVVTGGMGGLGEAICIKLAQMGYKVVTTYSPGNTKAGEWLKDMKSQRPRIAAPCRWTWPTSTRARRRSRRSSPRPGPSTCWSTTPASPAT